MLVTFEIVEVPVIKSLVALLHDVPYFLEFTISRSYGIRITTTNHIKDVSLKDTAITN